MKTNRAFTLIELLVVVSIIGLLSSVVLSSLATARAKARDATRLQNLREIRTALELYRTARGSYPATGPDVDNPEWIGSCPGWSPDVGTVSGPTGWIPNLAPTYIPVLPLDPKPTSASGYCYVYMSDGTDYMVLAYRTVETYTQATNPMPRPAFSQGVNYQNSFAVYSSGASDW